MSRLICLICCFIGVALAAPQKRLQAPLLDGRIVGGEETTVEEFPYTCQLNWYGSHICGCSVVKEYVVITAGHCTDGSSASSLTVRAGTSFRNSEGIVSKVAATYQNPNYSAYSLDWDISVIVLSNSYTFGSTIGPVALPSVGQTWSNGNKAIVTGWGTTFEGGWTAEKLRVLSVPIIGLEECQQAYQGVNPVTSRMLCAGVPEGGKDSCQGDSGGPLVVNGVLAGIVSWGYGCARPDYPGVYSNVGSLRQFITDVIGL